MMTARAQTGTLIGGGGGGWCIQYIHIFMFYPTSFFSTIKFKQDAYHRRKHEPRIRTSTALIPRQINMRELKHNISLDIKCGFLMHMPQGISHKQLIFLLEQKILRCYPP